MEFVEGQVLTHAITANVGLPFDAVVEYGILFRISISATALLPSGIVTHRVFTNNLQLLKSVCFQQPRWDTNSHTQAARSNNFPPRSDAFARNLRSSIQATREHNRNASNISSSAYEKVIDQTASSAVQISNRLIAHCLEIVYGCYFIIVKSIQHHLSFPTHVRSCGEPFARKAAMVASLCCCRASTVRSCSLRNACADKR